MMEFSSSIHALCNVHSAKKNVCVSSDIPCLKHNIYVFNNLFAVACSFLDKANGSKTDFHHDLYQARDSNDNEISSKLHMHVMSTILFKICQNTG